MVRYVTLRIYLGEIPPSVSFRPNYTLEWRYAKQGFLRSVTTPDPALWDTTPPKLSQHNFSTLDQLDNVTLQTEEFSGADSYMGQSSDDNDSANSLESAHPMMIDNLHIFGHFETIDRPSDTCPHTCVILNKNVTGLGGKNADDKLEKIIEMMISRKFTGNASRKSGSLDHSQQASEIIRYSTMEYNPNQTRKSETARGS